MSRQRIRTGLFGLLLGALFGGAAGALWLGLVTFFDDSTSFLGPARDWTFVAVLFGLVIGGIAGAVLGVLVGAVQADRRSAVIIGNIIGLVIAASQLTGGDDVYIPASLGMRALGMMVYCEALCLLVASILRKEYLRDDKSPPG